MDRTLTLLIEAELHATDPCACNQTKSIRDSLQPVCTTLKPYASSEKKLLNCWYDTVRS